MGRGRPLESVPERFTPGTHGDFFSRMTFSPDASVGGITVILANAFAASGGELDPK